MLVGVHQNYHCLAHYCFFNRYCFIKVLSVSVSCSTEASIQLVGGMNDYEGRVEICSGGVWSTVCDEFWGSLDAQVVCRQLGYSADGEENKSVK